MAPEARDAVKDAVRRAIRSHTERVLALETAEREAYLRSLLEGDDAIFAAPDSASWWKEMPNVPYYNVDPHDANRFIQRINGIERHGVFINGGFRPDD